MLVTSSVLVAGVLSLQASLRGDFLVAVQLILTAAVLDSLDGTLAREWDVATPLGAQLDSLCDLIAFGVAPGFVVVAAYFWNQPVLAAIVGCALALAGAFRLARFNTEDKGQFFSGMPITAAGSLLAAISQLPLGQNAIWLVPLSVILASLMISKVPYYGGKGERRRLLWILPAALALIWLAPSVGLMLAGAFFLLYGILLPTLHAAHGWEDRLASLRGASK